MRQSSLAIVNTAASAVSKRIGWPPVGYWCLPALVSLLRMLPFVWANWMQPPTGKCVLRVGYCPSDFLQYIALIRQAATEQSWLLCNPFTTDVHEPRFILLFHSLLGSISRVTGIAPDLVWELSRVPVTFAFFAVLWWFLKPVLCDAKDRVWAAVLIGLSGGLEGFVKPFASVIPDGIGEPFMQYTWHMYGWNTFQTMFNPLWMLGLTLTLVFLRPVLAPSGPRGKRDLAIIGFGFTLLHFVHPYSAIVGAAVVGAVAVAEWVFDRVDWAKHARIAGALVIPILLIVAVSRWQSQDPIYRLAAANVFGNFQLAVFWYPVTLGAVGVAALRGARLCVREQHPYRLSLLAWLAAVIFLHTSPVIDGYHFGFHLHLPLCILAAPVVRRMMDGLADGETTRWAAWTWLFALFASAPLVSAESLGDVKRRNLRPEEYAHVVEALSQLPPGNVLAPAELGNMVPAYTGHRVWVGHWFMTPSVDERAERYEEIAAGDAAAVAQLPSLIAAHDLTYLVLPPASSSAACSLLGDRVSGRQSFGALDLLVLRQR